MGKVKEECWKLRNCAPFTVTHTHMNMLLLECADLSAHSKPLARCYGKVI